MLIYQDLSRDWLEHCLHHCSSHNEHCDALWMGQCPLSLPSWRVAKGQEWQTVAWGLKSMKMAMCRTPTKDLRGNVQQIPGRPSEGTLHKKRVYQSGSERWMRKYWWHPHIHFFRTGTCERHVPSSAEATKRSPLHQSQISHALP